MNKKVTTHIKSIVNKTNFNRAQRRDLEEYLQSTFLENYNNYISENMSPELALNKALDKLGTPSEFSTELESNNINKISKIIQLISISVLTLSLLAAILANNNHSTFVEPLPNTVSGLFFNFFNININYKITEILRLDQIFNIFSMTIFFIPIGFFIPLACNKFNMLRDVLSSYIILTFIFELSKIFMLSNPSLIYIILNFIACLIGYIILKILISIISNIKK